MADDEQREARTNGAKDGWRGDLRSYFEGLSKEDETYAARLETSTKFSAEVARPALEEVCAELALYGKTCETGNDAGRDFIIVRGADEKTEFQYAVVVETRIQGVTPYVHCWYEPAPKHDEPPVGDEKTEDAKGDEDSDEKEEKDEKKDEKKGEKSDEGGSGEDADPAKSAAPKRTKTIEPLAGWTETRDLGEITRDEIANDFLAHYKDAVARLRAPMHAAGE